VVTIGSRRWQPEEFPIRQSDDAIRRAQGLSSAGGLAAVQANAQTISTVAGTGSYGFSGDNGAATSASIDTAYAVVADAQGNIFIADTRNQRVRRSRAAPSRRSRAMGRRGSAAMADPAPPPSSAFRVAWRWTGRAQSLHLRQWELPNPQAVGERNYYHDRRHWDSGVCGDGGAGRQRAAQLPAWSGDGFERKPVRRR